MSIVQTALKHKTKSFDLIVEFVCSSAKESGDKTAYYDNFILLHDFFHFCPHRIKKDKNMSKEVEHVMKGSDGTGRISKLKQSTSSVDNELYEVIIRI